MDFFLFTVIFLKFVSAWRVCVIYGDKSIKDGKSFLQVSFFSGPCAVQSSGAALTQHPERKDISPRE